MAKAAGYTAVISHRSGETEDSSTIADLAVGTCRWSDQDRSAVPLRPRVEVQPAAAHRRAAGRQAPYKGRAEFRG